MLAKIYLFLSQELGMEYSGLSAFRKFARGAIFGGVSALRSHSRALHKCRCSSSCLPINSPWKSSLLSSLARRGSVSALSCQKRSVFSSSASTAGGNHSEGEAETHFGYESVSTREKTAKVHGVFEQVATTYDKMNDYMSLGIHRLWKDEFVRMLAPMPGSKILDVAGGTGDIAFRLIKCMDLLAQRRPFSNRTPGQRHELGLPPSPTPSATPDVTVLDLSESMLEVGKSRATSLGLSSRLIWVRGNAEELPFPDDSFDAYTIAFGIRNVTHIDVALDEAYRVLKKGGRLLVLEFSQVKNPVLAWMYEKYSFGVIPVMGQLIASDWKSYQYLVESIRMFPDQQEFKEMIEEAGFEATSYRNLTQGICAIHSGFKL